MTGAIHFAMTHSEPGGLREIWNDISAGLEARGHRTERFVLYPNGDAAQRDHAEAEGWHHVLGGRAGGFGGVAKLFRALVGYLRRTRPAAVITAMPFANVMMPLAVRAARTGTRVYVSHHSPADTHNPALVRLDALTGRMREVAAVICVSHAVAASLADKPAAYRAKLVTIHNALPEPVERAIDALVAEDAPAKVPGRVVALGRLSYQKNYPMLLRAMAHVPQGTLDVVGAGEDEAELRALAETCGVAGRVRFLGQMTRGEALAHAATAQVFAQVSHYEGHSLALIEAARLGLPLVVSKVPVQVEGITDGDGALCGLPVPIGDDAGLGAVLARLLSDPVEREAWARRARALGVAASNRAMIDAYERLLVA
ncbi:glycosyltransferase involved in cell wall biosynthesis [Novosphingobium chloroacetimidivorans]|uniref:Glycosyltransferase involved in cell wall biosynthesis n=1 Tax=Novosphingobium chloroacetimidivorans TaxID=1428314 RepID=A0A7W7K6S2_9SPHN|nr:glycosyltransferase [Novosphingobium chloroacetimidivorans]MBB4857247.1 glycosyltransferase involved in cell wall biosynthesis [Novosphingobium chloroacetimidivorans]